jgi:hypothetical protein
VKEQQKLNPGVGTKIMYDLYEVFNKRNEKSIETLIELTIFHGDEPLYGTRVIVKTPITYSYEITNPTS